MMGCASRWGFFIVATVGLALVFLTFSAGSAGAAKISGTVTDNNGTQVPGAEVILYLNGTVCTVQNNPATTDVTGYYEFPSVPGGNYYIQADKDGYNSISESVYVSGSDVVQNLPIGGYIFRPTPPVPTPYRPPPTPTPMPTPTPAPTPTPTPRPSITLVPLPTRKATQPGFELLLALFSLGAALAVRRFK